MSMSRKLLTFVLASGLLSSSALAAQWVYGTTYRETGYDSSTNMYSCTRTDKYVSDSGAVLQTRDVTLYVSGSLYGCYGLNH